LRIMFSPRLGPIRLLLGLI